MSCMPNYNISINPALAKVIDQEIKAKKYSSRSEFFRDLVRDRFVEGSGEYDIAPLSSSDPDYALLKKRKRGARFIPLSNLLCQ